MHSSKSGNSNQYPFPEVLTIVLTSTILLTCMRKELVWAGIIGISFGLVIAFGAWRVRSSVVSKAKPVPTSAPQIGVERNRITIDKPRNLDVIIASPFTVSGITKPLTWVVISAENVDYLTQSADDGTFSANIEPKAGVNHIKVTSVNTQGDESSQEVLAVYSSSFQSESSTDTKDSEKTDSETDKEVALRVSQAENPPKAYIGTITDISDSTIQIKSADSQIQQIATDKYDVAVVNTKGTTNKTVKLADIAIGDYIVAMGYMDGNDVLDAKRILVSDTTTTTKISVSIQKVDSVTKKSLTVTPTAGGDASTITPNKDSEIMFFSEGKVRDIALSDIAASDTVIVVSDTTGTPVISRSLFNIKHEVDKEE